MSRLLIFLGDTPADDAWLRVDGDAVTARGPGLPEMPRPEAGEIVVAVVPGDAAVLHWVELPALAPAQTAAAARMLAAEVSGAAPETTHVAIGAPGPDGFRVLALTERAAMLAWLARLAAAGIDPDAMLPAPLLLATGGDDATRVLAGEMQWPDREAQWLVRGPRLGFAAEPALARMIIGARDVVMVTRAEFEAGLDAAAAAAAVDLRQGDFARTRRWTLDRRRLRRLAAMAAAVVLATLAVEVATMLRHDFAADRAELQLADAARSVLPRGTIVTDPEAQVAARLAQLGGDGGGFGALAGALVAAVGERPEVTVRSLTFAPQTGLVAELTAPAAADRDAIVAALQAQGLQPAMAAVRETDGEQVAELTVRAR